ncbi:MAG: hypothetical protein AAFR50_03385 [Pseudomonadota bacterium]
MADRALPHRRPILVPFARAVFLLGALAGCDALPPVQMPGRAVVPSEISAGPDAYTLARAAVADGNFSAALSHYVRVLEEYPRGQDGAEVRLEFANVLLYAEMPERALEVAALVPELTRDRELRGRAAILMAIAEHSKVETYLASAPPYEQGRDRARAVYLAMVETYETHGRYDAEGIIPARLGVLREGLANLEIRKMKSERAAGEAATASQRAQYIQLEFGDTQTVRENAQLLQAVALRS